MYVMTQDEVTALSNAVKYAATVTGATAELIGQWVWLYFEDAAAAKPHIERMKELGFKFAPKKKAWYYAGVPCKGRGKPISELRQTWGYAPITNKED